MSRRPSRSTAPQLIAALLGYFGPQARLLHAAEREWASATFSGARHMLSIVVPAADATMASLIAALPEHEFDLRRDIVADCSVRLRRAEGAVGEPVDTVVEVEILTVAAD